MPPRLRASCTKRACFGRVITVASLIVLGLKLAKATEAGDQVAIKRLNKQIADERKKRGKKPRRGL